MSINLYSTHSQILKWFQLEFPELVKSMQTCTHHFDEMNINPYHMEGDIWTHTMMVYKMAEVLSRDNHFVKWSSILHDIGKPTSMELNVEHQKKRFIGHEGISTFMAIDILNKTDMTTDEKLHIVKLISMHGSLFHYIKLDGKIKDDLYPTFEGNKSLLADLVHQVAADSSGRFTDDSKVSDHDPIFTLNLPKHFQSVIDSLTDEVYRGTKPHNLTVLVGPPCSRKSTWLTSNITDNTVVISRDALVESVGKKYGCKDYSEAFKFLRDNEDISKDEVDAVLNKQLTDARQAKKEIVIDMTNMSKKTRRKWISALEKDYNKKAVVFFTGYQAQLDCNAKRGKETGKTISKGVTINMIKGFALPMYGEGFDTIDYIWQD